MMFDAHSHYNLDQYTDSSSWLNDWQTAQDHGVQASAIIGTNPETSQRAISQAATHPTLYPVVGIHPTELIPEAGQPLWTPSRIDTALQAIGDLITSDVVALGEIGLDYYWLTDHPEQAALRNQQQQLLRDQLQLAEQHALPVVIHLRDRGEDAYWDLLSIIQEYSLVRCNLHCISGPLQFVEKAAALGTYIGVTGNVTYPSADHIRQLIRVVPQDRILTETDAPYLPPQEYRGKTCEPWMIRLTTEYLTTHFEVTEEQLWKNACRFFGVEPATTSPIQ